MIQNIRITFQFVTKSFNFILNWCGSVPLAFWPRPLTGHGDRQQRIDPDYKSCVSLFFDWAS